MGHYLYSIAYNTIGRVLLKKRLDYYNTEFLNVLLEYINNLSITRFIIEYTILVSIIINSLSYLPYNLSLIKTLFFKGEILSFNTSKDKTVLYIP
jgi:hypothetical protein